MVKKSYMKKKVSNMAKPKMTSTPSQTDVKKSVNNNSTNAKNRNQEKSLKKLQTSQSKDEVIVKRKEPSDVKVKDEEEATNVDNE